MVTRTKLFCLVFIILFACSCNENKQKIFEKPKSTNIDGMAFFKFDLIEEAQEMDELKYSVDEERINEIAEILNNVKYTKQEDLDEALVLLNRMKKEDYEKTYLLYLKNRLENEILKMDYEGKEYVVFDFENSLNYHKILFEFSNEQPQSFPRLPKKIQRNLEQLTYEKIKRDRTKE